MHEILFRGKRADNGEWVNGWYCEACYGAWPLRPSIIPMEEARGGYYRPVEIDTATVGQYTGLTDRNGKRIFEGDIVKHYNDTFDPSLFDVGVIFWDDENCSFMRTSRASDREDPFCVSHTCVYEVIGNIHDNPELMERGRE